MAGRFGSVVTAMVTPFRADHGVDLDGAQELAVWLTDNGSDSVFVVGSTGESPTLSHKEKTELFRVVGEAIAGKGKLICGTGTYSTAETLELTASAEKVGADGIVVVTPYYNKPPQRGLVAHFHEIADATELPIIAYNIPSRTGTRIEHDTMLRIAEKPNVVAVKDSTGDFKAISNLISEAPEGFEVYSGDDWATFGYVCLGAVGVVSVASHLVGSQIRQMIDLIETGDVPAARKLHEDLSPLFNALFVTSNPIPVKAALDMLGRPGRRGSRWCRRRPRSGTGSREHWRTPVSSDPAARLVFLGGVGEVGRNMACLELDGRILIVDVGLSFPSGDMPGIDLVLPDFDFVRQRADRIRAVVLTHGHEDHIGALPYLLRDIDRRVEIFGTPFTLALLQSKLDEHEVAHLVDLRTVTPGEQAVADPFTMRFLRVTHSIPDGMAVVVDTPFGSILHTGDFKIDQTPLDGRATDLHGLAEEAGRGKGVHLLLSDSTNAEEPGYSLSERTVGPVLQDIVAGAPGLVVAACFSSHIHRVQQIVNAARANERVVAILGRSMHKSVGAARELDYLQIPDQDLVDIEEIDRIDPGRVVVICTGSQGEPFSALSLMAQRQHKWVEIGPGDTVVLSSSLIPGNEPAIHRVVDSLYRTGADVFHMPSDPVHASGHAAQEELRLMLSLVRPRWFIPVHGEQRHLQHHARLAHEVGIPPERTLVCEDGDVVEVGEEVRLLDRVQAGMTFVDGLGIGDVGGEVLRDRRKLAGDGVVVVVVIVDSQTGELVGGPDVVNRGFVHEETSGDILAEGRERVIQAVKESAEVRLTDPSALQQNVRRALARYFNEVTQRKPVILPVIMEV